jgi:hypothetical protein
MGRKKKGPLLGGRPRSDPFVRVCERHVQGRLRALIRHADGAYSTARVYDSRAPLGNSRRRTVPVIVSPSCGLIFAAQKLASDAGVGNRFCFADDPTWFSSPGPEGCSSTVGLSGCRVSRPSPSGPAGIRPGNTGRRGDEAAQARACRRPCGVAGAHRAVRRRRRRRAQIEVHYDAEDGRVRRDAMHRPVGNSRACGRAFVGVRAVQGAVLVGHAGGRWERTSAERMWNYGRQSSRYSALTDKAGIMDIMIFATDRHATCT